MITKNIKINLSNILNFSKTKLVVSVGVVVILSCGSWIVYRAIADTKGGTQHTTATSTIEQTKHPTQTVPAEQITSFAECKAAAGSKLLQASPQQCVTSTGQTFTEPTPSSTTVPTPSKVQSPAVSTSKSTSGSGKSSSQSSGSGSSGGQSGGSGQSSLNCTDPVYQGSWPQVQYPGWTDASGVTVSGDIQTASTGQNSQQLNVCSASNWNVVANFPRNGGSINAYPDTEFTLTGDKTIAQYNSLQTCFGEKEPIPSGSEYPTTGGSEWDYAYDVWLNDHTGENVWANDIEIMVWNDWTDTSLYPPAGARAVTIDGIAYHVFKGGGANEWIYTRDTPVMSGCFDMLDIFKDLVANPSTSGITNSSAPQHLEYGVEISATNGTQTFQITNATLTAN